MKKAYGRVHPARLVETGEKVALKKISKQYTDSASFTCETDARKFGPLYGFVFFVRLRNYFDNHSCTLLVCSASNL